MILVGLEDNMYLFRIVLGDIELGIVPVMSDSALVCCQCSTYLSNRSSVFFTEESICQFVARSQAELNLLWLDGNTMDTVSM